MIQAAALRRAAVDRLQRDGRISLWCIEHHAALRPASNSCAWFAAAVMSRGIPVIDLAAKNAAVRIAGN
jgi:hypothetical protein